MDRLRLIWLSIGIGALYWIIESAVVAFIFHESTFISQVFIPAPHELWMRLLTAGILISLVYIGFIFISKKKIEDVLLKTKKQYQILFESNPHPMWVYDLETLAFLAVNDAALKKYGYSREEFLSMTIKDIRPPDDVAALLENISRVTEGLDEAGVWRHRKKDGTIILVEITSHTLNFGDRKAEVVNASDVTERIKAEQILRETSQNLQTLIKASPLAIISLNQDGEVTMWSPAAERIFGWSEQEVIGKINPIVPQEKIHEFKTLRERSLHGESLTDVEVQRKKKDGSPIIVSLSTAPMYNAKGEIIGVIGIIADITERKRMTEQIYEIKQDWEYTFNSITDMVTVHDKDYNIILANKAAEKILNLPLFETTNDRKCFKYYHGTEKPPEGCPSCQCLQTGVPATFEIFEPHLNMFIEIRAIPRFDSQNNLVGLIHVVRDITERKKAEEERNKLLEVIARGKREWEMTFDSATELIMLVDKGLNIIRCNKSLADFVGIPIKEMAGHKCYEFFPCGEEQAKYCKDKIIAEEPTEWTELKTDTGHWLYVSHRPVYDEKGNFMHSVVIASDITDMKNAQQVLMESERELKKRVGELEKFYEIAIDRELKMKELKKENARLNAEIEKHKNGDKER